MQRAVIFGAAGQDGQFLAKRLATENVDVIAVSRSGGTLKADIADFSAVAAIVERYQPGFIFHFAAESSTSHDCLFANHAAISTGALNILESAKRYLPSAKIFLSGSAMQFENNGLPINEKTPFAATSPYAVARIHATYAGRYYREKCGLSVYTGFFFNHDSELRSERHVNQKVAAAVKRIAAGSGEKVLLGSLDVEKEFTYAGDVAEAIWLLVNQDCIFEAVIGCGETHTITEWAECCFTKAGLNWRDHVIEEAGYIPEYTRLVSDPVVIKSLGWEPQVSFSQLADKMLRLG